MAQRKLTIGTFLYLLWCAGIAEAESIGRINNDTEGEPVTAATSAPKAEVQQNTKAAESGDPRTPAGKQPPEQQQQQQREQERQQQEIKETIKTIRKIEKTLNEDNPESVYSENYRGTASESGGAPQGWGHRRPAGESAPQQQATDPAEIAERNRDMAVFGGRPASRIPNEAVAKAQQEEDSKVGLAIALLQSVEDKLGKDQLDDATRSKVANAIDSLRTGQVSDQALQLLQEVARTPAAAPLESNSQTVPRPGDVQAYVNLPSPKKVEDGFKTFSLALAEKDLQSVESKARKADGKPSTALGGGWLNKKSGTGTSWQDPSTGAGLLKAFSPLKEKLVTFAARLSKTLTGKGSVKKVVTIEPSKLASTPTAKSDLAASFGSMGLSFPVQDQGPITYEEEVEVEPLSKPAILVLFLFLGGVVGFIYYLFAFIRKYKLRKQIEKLPPVVIPQPKTVSQLRAEKREAV